MHNQIYFLRNNEGIWVDDQEDINNLIFHHFQQLYTAQQSPAINEAQHSEDIDLVLRELDLPQLTSADKQTLLTPFLPSEVHTAIMDIANDKSPGVDGFSSAYFKIHWDILGPSICQAVNRFSQTGHLLKEWNRTLLILIPKMNLPEEVNHLRPISLCNTMYKCISKCMVNRMKHLLPKLIADYQNAFIPRRHMDDNILISHELTHTINKQRSGNRHLATLKLDMSKAYDRVSWLFILKILTAYGFPPHWITLVQQCISTVVVPHINQWCYHHSLYAHLWTSTRRPPIPIYFPLLYGCLIVHDNPGYRYKALPRDFSKIPWSQDLTFIFCRWFLVLLQVDHRSLECHHHHHLPFLSYLGPDAKPVEILHQIQSQYWSTYTTSL